MANLGNRSPVTSVSRTGPLRRFALGILLGACALGALGQETPTEYDVKAAYLFNFAKFLEWPAEAFAGRQAPLTLCIAGRDPFGAALAAYDRRTVQSRELRLRHGVTLEGLSGCHMLFVADSEERQLRRILRAALELPIVTVSDIEGFADAGGVIGLVTGEKRVQFEVNLASAQQARVKVSSQLLRIARNTRGRFQ